MTALQNVANGLVGLGLAAAGILIGHLRRDLDRLQAEFDRIKRGS